MVLAMDVVIEAGKAFLVRLAAFAVCNLIVQRMLFNEDDGYWDLGVILTTLVIIGLAAIVGPLLDLAWLGVCRLIGSLMK